MEFDISDIKQRVDIEELAEHLGISVNHVHKAKCPFHDDNDPSLHFYDKRFHCYACGENGDIFNLVMQKEGLNFADALKYICSWANIPFRDNIRRYSMQSSKNHGLDLAYELYKNLNDVKKLEQWADQRVIPVDFLTSLGAVFLDGNALTSSRQKKLNRAEWAGLIAAGVIAKNTYAKSEGNQAYLDLGFIPQDIFYYPGVLFPVKNSSGEISGFAYRAADSGGQKVPKYKYNQYFAKDSNLFGIDRIEKLLAEFRKSNRGNTNAVFDLFLVEGIMDAVRLQSLNINVCAILGASIGSSEYLDKGIRNGKKQLDLIQQLVEKLNGFTVKVHVFLDNDQAGVSGAQKSFLQFLKLANDFPNLQFDYLYFPPEKYGKDPDEIFKDRKRTQLEKLLSKNVYSPADFIVAAELSISPPELLQQWNDLHFWDRRNAISRLSSRISPAGQFDFSGLLYYGIGEDERKTNSDAANLLIAEFSRVIKKTSLVIPASEDSTEIQWGNALKLARDSYSTDDFPVDQAGWDRCFQGLATLRHILSEMLANSPVLEPYTPAIIPRNPGEAPRLLTLPSQEDLIIETAVLLEIFQYGVNVPGSIPLVYDAGAKITTYNTNSTEEETVSFAYQYNCRTVTYSGIQKAETGIFKHYAECWTDYNDFMLKKTTKLPLNRKNISCLRLDIHRYYDSISRNDIQQLLSRIFTSDCLLGIRNASPALREIMGKSSGEYFSRFVDWVCQRSFAFQYYDPTDGNPRSSIFVDKGIPQGPNLSAWLANILLFDMDKKIKARCLEINRRERKTGSINDYEEVSWYARYVDDMIIAAPTREDTESLKQLIQLELEKLGLFLSLKIDDELISSRDDLYELIRKNRGMKFSPYGGENIDYEDFDYQDIVWKSLIGNLDRKNFLSYIYSEDAILQAFHPDDNSTLYNSLKGAIFSSNEVRYRDYRRVVALLIYSIFSEDSEKPEFNADKLIDAFENVIGKLDLTKEADDKNSLLNINSVWPIFSIFEGIQNVLVKRYDLIPVLPVEIRKGITEVRQRVAKAIIDNGFLERIAACIFNKVNLDSSSFSVLLKTWRLALVANACFFLKCEFNNNVNVSSQNILHFRYLLSIPNAAQLLLNSLYSNQYVYHGTILAFHKMINNLQKGESFKLDDFDHITQPSAFKHLCLLCEQPNTDNQRGANSTELFDALTTFANAVPPDKQFDQLRNRSHLLCQELNDKDKYIRLIASPIDEKEKYIIAFIHDNNTINNIKIVTPQATTVDVPQAIFPPELLSFSKNNRVSTCKLDIYTADTAQKNICFCAFKTSSAMEQLNSVREVFKAIWEHKEALPYLILAKENIVKINGSLLPIAWKANSVYSKAIIGSGKLLELSDSMVSVGKAGCVALESAKVSITSGYDVLAKISLSQKLNYENSNWIYEFLLQYAKSLLTGKRFIGTSNFYRYAPIRKIEALWSVIDHLSNTSGPKSLLACFFNYRLHEIVLQADIALNKAGVIASAMGYSSNVLYYTAPRFFLNDDGFFCYFRSAMEESLDKLGVRPCSSRKNINAWYSLSILMEQFHKIEINHQNDTYYISLSLRIYALVTWLQNLSREFYDIAVSDEFRNIVIEKIEKFNLQQGAWQANEIDTTVDIRFSFLLNTCKQAIEQKNMTLITPLGWCIFAYTVLGKKKPLDDEFLEIFACSPPITDDTSDDLRNILGDTITLDKIDKLFGELNKWEQGIGVAVYLNSGCNPTTGSVVNINKQENVLSPGQMNFAGLPHGDSQVEHDQTQSVISYQWSETWYDNQLKSIACVGNGLAKYVALLQKSSQLACAVHQNTEPMAEPSPDLSQKTKETHQPATTGTNDTLKIDSVFRMQQDLWETRQPKSCQSHHRIALFQFDIGYSSYFPIQNEESGQTLTNAISEEDSKKDSQHAQSALDKAIELCKTFKVEILLLPEYSVHPVNIKAMIERLWELKSDLFIWAGTFREYKKNAKEILAPYCQNNIDGLCREHAATLCVISRNGIEYVRNKKYPSIGGKEDFSPLRDEIKPLYCQNYPAKCNAGRFVTELICSEIFMATSPANINTITKHHRMLMEKYQSAMRNEEKEKYYANVVSRDLKIFSEAVGYCSNEEREVRRSILFVPAMTTRNEDFHILGQANFLAASLCTVFCNGVSTRTYDAAPHGGSCFIGYDSTNSRATLGHTPYSGFSPGILITGHGAPLTKDEESLVIVDIDPYNMAEGRPRPQMLPIPLNLVAHIPFIPLNDKLKALIEKKFEGFWVRIANHQNDKKDSELHEDIMAFWDNELKELIPKGNENISRRFEALRHEATRIGSLPAFATLLDFKFYE